MTRPRRLAAATLALTLLAGCQYAARGPGGLGNGYAQRNQYVCNPAQQALYTSKRRLTFYPGPGPGFLAWFEPASGTVALKFREGPVHHLSRVHGGAGVLYADDTFAWNDDGTNGILTAVRDALTYDCRKLP